MVYNNLLLITCIVFIFGFGESLAAIYPKELPKCHFGDGECIRDAMQFILNNFPNGHPKLYLQTFEPLDVNLLQIIQEGERPVALNMSITDLKIYGISNANITKVDGFEKSLEKSKIKVRVIAPQIKLIGDYDINGRILILPITGKGKCELLFEDFDILFTIIPVTYKRRGKEYFETDTFTIQFDMSSAHIHFGNLFNGDEALGDQMNIFLNENWRDIISELKSAFVPIIEGIFKGIFDRFFSKFPYNELFLE